VARRRPQVALWLSAYEGLAPTWNAEWRTYLGTLLTFGHRKHDRTDLEPIKPTGRACPIPRTDRPLPTMTPTSRRTTTDHRDSARTSPSWSTEPLGQGACITSNRGSVPSGAGRGRPAVRRRLRRAHAPPRPASASLPATPGVRALPASGSSAPRPAAWCGPSLVNVRSQFSVCSDRGAGRGSR